MVIGRYAWLTVVTLVLALVVIRLATLRGIYRPLLVAGESMVPTLWGPSWREACQGCEISLRSVARPGKQVETLVCFNCGTRSAADEVHVEQGDCVFIDTAAYWFRKPERWDLVAIKSDDGSFAVKRILGLPGETVGFRRGDLFINGDRTGRSLRQALATSIAVADDRFRSHNKSRWHCGDPGTWTKLRDGFRCQALHADSSPPLVYHHVNVYRNNRPERILDDYPANQHVSRRMFPVDDAIVQFDCSAAAGTVVQIALMVQQEVLAVSFQRADDFWLVQTSADNHSNVLLPPNADSADAITVAHIDGTLWLAINGNAVKMEKSADVSMDDVLGADRPIAIRCSRAEASTTIRRLRVARDLAWWYAVETDPWSRDQALPSGRYFVVGDNIPVSIDSRHTKPAAAGPRIIGRVHLVE